MAAGCAIAALARFLHRQSDIFLAVLTFGTNQLGLLAGMNIMAGKAGNGILFSGMQKVKIGGAVTETGGLLCILLQNKCLIMAAVAEPWSAFTQLELVVCRMGCVAAEAAVLLNRSMDGLLAALVVMALVTELAALVLDSVEGGILLVVTTGCIVAGGALLAGHGTVHEGSRYFALMTLVAGFAADGINGSGLCRCSVCIHTSSAQKCKRDRNAHHFH